MKKILVVADRPGWAIDRLAKPVTERYENVRLAYFNTSEDRYLDTGFSPKGGVHYDPSISKHYDVIHYHRVEAALIGLGNVKSRKIIHIHTERDDYSNVDFDQFDDIICPTRYTEKKYKDRVSRARVHYLPHHIDLDLYKCKFQTPNDRHVGFIGRVLEHKRYDIIQKAINDAGLFMSGCGYIDHPKIYGANAGKIKGGSDYVFDIFKPESKMIEFYGTLNLLICASWQHIETGPLPTLEAMAMGVPIISTRVGWAKDNCEHLKNIYFIEENEIKDLSKIIKKVYNNKKLRETLRNGGLNLIKDFGLDEYSKKLIDIYENSNKI